MPLPTQHKKEPLNTKFFLNGCSASKTKRKKRHTRHLSKHVSQATKSFPIILDLCQQKGGIVHEEVIPY